MAIDEVRNIILGIQGQAKLEELTKQLKAQRDVIENLNDGLKKGQITQTQFASSAEPFAKRIASINAEMAGLQKSTKALTSPQGLMQLSYIFDDLTNTSGGWDRKLSSISNNLPGLLSYVPKLAAFAGALGIAGTAAIALYSNWDTFMRALDSTKLTDAEQGLDRLTAKAKETSDAFNKLAAGPTDSAESRAMHALDSSITGANAGKIADAAAAGLEASGKGASMSGREERDLARIEAAERSKAQNEIDAAPPGERAGLVAGIPERIRRAQFRRRQEIAMRLKAANQARARELVGGLTQSGEVGAVSRALLGGLVGGNPGAFPAGFLGAIENASPDNIRQQDDIEARGRANAEAFEKREERQKARQAKELRKVEEAANAGADVREMNERDAEIAARKASREAERARKKAEHDKPRNDAARAIRDQAGATGTAVNDVDVDAMIGPVLALYKKGVAVNYAVLMAYNARMAEIQKLDARLNQQLGIAAGLGAQFGTGGNQGVNYSGMPNIFP